MIAVRQCTASDEIDTSNLQATHRPMEDNQSAMNNMSNYTLSSPEWFPGLQLAACLFYSIILLVGVTGNVLVILIVMRYQDMRNATNLLLTNLSVADLFLLLFCTADGYQHLYGKDKHRLGKFMCRSSENQTELEERLALENDLSFQAVSVHLFKTSRQPVRY